MKRFENSIWLWRREASPVASAEHGLARAREWLSAVGPDVPLIVEAGPWCQPTLPALGEGPSAEAVAGALDALGRAAFAPEPLRRMLDEARKALGLTAPLLVALDGPWRLLRNTLGTHLQAVGKEQPDRLKATLAELTRSVQESAAMLVVTDVDGLVLCVSDARFGRVLGGLDYDAVVRPAHEAVLSAAASAGKLRVVQVADEPDRFDRFGKYHCDGLAWADREHPPSIAYARDRVQPVLIGGLSEAVVTEGDLAAIREQADDARRQAGAHRLVIGVGRPLDRLPAGNVRF